jgi:predicted AAA+ superfamily ATPase
VGLLVAASVVFLLLPYRRNLGKRIIKSPKIYFIDTGLAAFLTGLQTPRHLISGPMAGPLFETFVVSELVKRFRTLQKAVNLYFWRSTDGHEVDLLIEAEGELTPVEIKLTSTLKPAHQKGLKKWREIAGMEDQRAYIVSSSPITGNLGHGIHNIHWAGL